MAHVTHAVPRASGYPTVLAQEANLIFGTGVGHIMFFVVQAATALILYTGGNTSFNGFPFLASYVAGDAFLPRWLLKRGHRLVFSNAIIALTIVSTALVIVRDANVNSLVPMYAIGVFTAFTMAGFGMARYHKRLQEPGWRHKRIINLAAGALSAVVVAIFAVVKFTEGAWLVVILFPILWFAFIRLNQEYTMEAEVLERIGERKKPPEQPNYPRRTVFLLVDSFDLATLAAMRYARSLRPTTLRAVHFVIDTAEADMLREEWTRADRGIVLDFIDCPDRRLARAAAELVSAEATTPGTHVTAVLPRRTYSTLLGRLLHDRTADKIAAVVSRIPHCAATIVPFDVRNRLEVLRARGMNGKAMAPTTTGTPAADGRTAPAGKAATGEKASVTGAVATPGDGQAAPEHYGPGAVAAGAGEAGREDGHPAAPAPAASAMRGLLPGRRNRPRRGESEPAKAKAVQASYERPAPSPGVKPIGSIQAPGRATVEGRVRAVEIRPVERSSVLAVEISDSTGDLTALFYGRSHIPGIICGSRVRFRGSVGARENGPIMINPAYELLAAGESPPNSGD
jgi:hypothetical protein